MPAQESFVNALAVKDYAEVSKLLQEDLNVNEKIKYGDEYYTPFQFVLINGVPSLMKGFAEKGALVEDPQNWLMLHKDLNHNITREAVDALIDLTSDWGEVLEPAMVIAVSNKDEYLVSKLLSSVPPVPVEIMKTVLSFSCEVGNLDILTRCLEQGLLPVDKDILSAVSYNHYDLVKTLIEQWEMDITNIKDLIFVALNVYGGESCLELLLKNNVFIDSAEGSLSPLLYNAENGSTSYAKILVENGVDIDTKDDSGNNALHYAIKRNYPQMVSVLVEMGIDINAVNNEGMSALMTAAKKEHLDLVKLLIELGADVSLKNNKGTNALMLSCLNKDPEIVSLLIESGADVNEVNANNMSALQAAIIQRSDVSEIVELLMNAGADANILDANGKDVLSLAEEKKKFKSMKIIEQLQFDQLF